MFHINWTTTTKEHATHYDSLPHTDLPTKAKLKAHLPHEALLDLPSPFCSDLLKHVFKVDLWLLALEIITWVSWDIIGLELNSLSSILESLGGKHITIFYSWVLRMFTSANTAAITVPSVAWASLGQGRQLPRAVLVYDEVLTVRGKWENSRVNFLKH